MVSNIITVVLVDAQGGGKGGNREERIYAL